MENRKLKNIKATLLILFLSFSLAACGGSGGGNGVMSSIDVGAQAAASNVLSVMSSGGNATGVATVAATTATTTAVTGVETNSSNFNAVILMKKIRHITPTTFQGMGMVSGALMSIADQACAVSGTFSASLDDRDNNSVVSSGDSMSMSFSQCDDGTDLMNGSLSMTLSALVGDSALPNTVWQEDLSVALTQFTVKSAGGDFSVNGAMTINSHSDGVLETYNMVFKNLALVDAGLSYSFGNFTVLGTFDNATGTDTEVINGDIRSREKGGFILKTLVPMVTLQTDVNPSSGALQATLDDGGVLLITALSNTQVQLETDVDGDGIMDTSEVVAWSAVTVL